jgi:hypothetical protein
MLGFRTWLEQYQDEEAVDERQVDAIYDKTRYAIQMVRLYDQTLPREQRLLKNISTVANLVSGAYGLYNSGENHKTISPNLRNKIRMKFGEDYILKHGLSNTPKVVLQQYFPDMQEDDIKEGDVIHVNVSRIVRELGDTLQAIIEIASTVVHEATHELERETKGSTSEVGPVDAERKFKMWVKSNLQTIMQKVPQLRNLQHT